MLEEAVGLIRELFTGRQVNHRGKYYTAETARLYSLPANPPPIYLSGFGEQATQLAARIADGYMSVMPDADMVRLYRDSGGGDRPVQGGLKACWGPDPAVHLAALREFAEAGFDEVYVQQVGGAPEAFFDFFGREVLPRARG